MTERQQFQTRKCNACGLRFPVQAGSPLGESCPHCSETTAFVEGAYVSHEVAESDELFGDGVRLEALLDNVRSLRNVGSVFRSADGAGVQHLHLVGFTPTPDHPKLEKTSLGAEKSVPWTRYGDAIIAANELKARGCQLWAIEAGPRSESLFAQAPPLQLDQPVVLVLGHEVSGVDPRLMDLCDRVLRLPMLGVKGSLNVSVAFGIAAYWIRFGAQPLADAHR